MGSVYRHLSRQYGKRDPLQYNFFVGTVIVTSVFAFSGIFYELPPFQTGIAIGIVYTVLSKIFACDRKL